MGGLADSIGSIAVEITGDYSELQTALDDASHYAEQSAEQIAESFNSKSAELRDSAHETESAFSELGDKVIDLAAEFGIALGAAEMLKQTFEAFTTVQDATSALTVLTGSAEEATAQIDQLRQMAMDQNLALPQLLEANQRLNVFGFAADDITLALQAAADAAVGMHRSVEDVSNAIARTAASGMAAGRTLTQLGLTTGDLASVMGTSEGDVKKMFAALDQETRLQVLIVALDKVRGASQQTASDLSRQWQGVRNTFHEFFANLGDFLAPAAEQFLTFFKTVAAAANVWVDALRIAFQKVELLYIRITQGAEAARQKIAEFAAEENKRNAETAKSATATEDLNKKMADLTKHIREVVANTEIDTKKKEDHLKGIKSETDSIAILTDQYDQFIKRQRETTQEIAKYKTEQEALGRTLTTSAAAGEFFFNQVLKGASDMEALRNSLPPLVDDLGNFTTTGERSAKSQEELNKQIQGFNKELDGMLGKIKPPMDALHEALAKIDVDLASGNFAKVQGIIKQLAVDDLPTAVAEQRKFLDALEQSGASAKKIAAAQRTLLELQSQLTAAGRLSFAAFQGVDHALSQVGSSFAKLIVQGGDFGKMMQQLFRQVAQTILSTVLNALVKMGEEFIIQKITQHAINAATSVAAVTNAAGVGYANAFASIAAIPIIGPEIAPGVAAATAAAIEAGGIPLASAAGGGVFGADTIVQAHAEEMILPASLSNGLQDMIQNNRTGGGAGNGLTIAIQNMSGVTRDTVDALATHIIRKARLAGAFR